MATASPGSRLRTKTITQATTKFAAAFWVIVHDTDGNECFANPTTGETRWDLDDGQFVLPRSPDGDWFELMDEGTGLPYWHHTGTGETTWYKPSNAFIIPLIGVQQQSAELAMSRSRSVQSISTETVPTEEPSMSRSSSGTTMQSVSTPDRPHFRRNYSRPSGKANQSKMPKSKSAHTIDSFWTAHSVPRLSEETEVRTIVEPITVFEAATQTSPVASLLSTPTKPVAASKARSGSRLNLKRLTSRPRLSAPAPPLDTPPVSERVFRPSILGRKASDLLLRKRTKSTPTSESASPIPALPSLPRLDFSPTKKRASVVLFFLTHSVCFSDQLIAAQLEKSSPSKRRSLIPLDLAEDVRRFSSSEFAREHFQAQSQRRGLFKRTVPVGELASWQSTQLREPLLNLPASVRSVFPFISRTQARAAALKCFELILAIGKAEPGELPDASFDDETLGRIQHLLIVALGNNAVRDEALVQIIKQLNGSPSTASAIRIWRLLQACLSTFAPSKDLEKHLRSFLARESRSDEQAIANRAQVCLRRFDSIAQRGPSGRVPALNEIEVASRGAGSTRVFGEPLTAPENEVPRVLSFLCQALLDYGALHSAGIFRVPGDAELANELKTRIDADDWRLEGMTKHQGEDQLDEHALAALLKLWLRDLPEPLIPMSLYEAVISSSDAQNVLGVLRSMPPINRRVAAYRFVQPEVVERTRMDPTSLSLVWTPAWIRQASSTDLVTAMKHSHSELVFMLSAITYVNPHDVDALGAQLSEQLEGPTPIIRVIDSPTIPTSPLMPQSRTIPIRKRMSQHNRTIPPPHVPARTSSSAQQLSAQLHQ